MKWKKLKNAPIREAVIDLKFSKPPDAELLIKFNQAVKDRYPKQSERYVFGVTASFKAGKIPEQHTESSSTLDGFTLSNEENKFVILNGKQGITISKLAPYNVWEDLRDEGISILKTLSELNHQIEIKRVALRYINEFDFTPELSESIEMYFKLVPLIPSGMPFDIVSFDIQMQLPKPEFSLNSIIKVKMSSKKDSPSAHVVFDIDVFKIDDYGNNVIRIFKDLEVIRNYKNEIFFSTITDKMKLKFN